MENARFRLIRSFYARFDAILDDANSAWLLGRVSFRMIQISLLVRVAFSARCLPQKVVPTFSIKA